MYRKKVSIINKKCVALSQEQYGIGTKKLCYRDKRFTLTNGYGCTGDILVHDAKFSIRYICFQDNYIIAGKYKLTGVASIDEFI